MSQTHSAPSTPATSSAPASTTADAPRAPGRPSTFSPELFEQLLSVIRELGVSDSAAANCLGLSTSTLSRWKREYPQLRLHLLRAREECRVLHFQRIVDFSQSRTGWRASAWILEHLFPADYSPRASEREKFQQMEARQREAEEAAEEAAELAPAADDGEDESNSQPQSADTTTAAAPAQPAPPAASPRASATHHAPAPSAPVQTRC